MDNRRDTLGGGAPKKVAIVGGGPSRRNAPYDDPTWEIWAFSSRMWQPPRISRWFEIHAMTDLRQQLATFKRGRRSFRSYIRFMQGLEVPVYMQEVDPSIPSSVRFPIEKLVAEFGRPFTSTASFLIALAILEGYEVIGLWGINPKSGNYLRQRPAIRTMLGMARQRGIELRFPKGFSMSIPGHPKCVDAPALYAYEWKSPRAWWRANVRRRLRRSMGRKRRSSMSRRRRRRRT